MRKIFAIAILLAVTACQTSKADNVKYLQCVPYARNLSGIEIYGDAHTWWKSAASKYQRGKAPKKGAVMVLSKTKALEYGHLAVVRKVVSNRIIYVNHANWGSDIWGRGKIYKNMKVKDVSKYNDWSRVRFWSLEHDNYGATHRNSGFIYNKKINS